MFDRIRIDGCQSLLTAAQASSLAGPIFRRTAISSTRCYQSKTSLAEDSAGPPRIRSCRPSPLRILKEGHISQRALHVNHDFASRPCFSNQKPRKATPLDEITRLRELINRANATNSKLSKERILAEFDDLTPLLAFLYDPYTRLHVTSHTVHNYLFQRRKDEEWQKDQAPLIHVPTNRSRDKSRAAALRAQREHDVRDQVPATLLELFQQLSLRQITGNEALAVIHNFLDQHRIIEQHEYALSGSDDPDLSTSELFRRGLLRPTSLEIFYRCLDRNLKAGFREAILRQAFAASPLTPSTKAIKAKSKQQQEPPDTQPITFRGTFEVALGRTVTRPELPTLFTNKDAPRWYASRKLDGVRCLFVVRLQRRDDDKAQWKVASILALSRNGRPFSALAVLERDIARLLPLHPGLSHLIEKAQSSNSASRSDNTDKARAATLILDGEICILRPPKQASIPAKKQMDAAMAISSEESTEQTMVEDFAAVVGLIKRKNYIIPEPAFFPFDLLTLDEFTQWRSKSRSRRTFSQRLEALEWLVSFWEADASSQQKQSLVRRLSQRIVSTTEQVDEMLATASQRGWEGLVLRQDVPYEGKRTSAIRKIKKWREAEYAVQSITVGIMRLPIDGQFEERQAMAAVQIEHKGTRVSVGSGFTPEQRVEFARDPDKIVGKVVTVEYFDESTTISPTSARDASVASAVESAAESGEDDNGTQNQVYSLRFPRIKHIWGERRDI
ncbi:uncharacterized protein MEPE_01286 [Melanopsichium pennsylvanicum]|uniref:ATP-dependent DNA ligase family profile domain-containing protein n=2 Tax=Melanopsichium pennsylvanicum TaxID=63383 RepID=A0AAJ4XHI3_9BASI|nr:conserved hypothetical protein [Melanopsichium pennsylvanicum 4]SNX82580.1 uncharacterized protein MEPE_01286 [Melanopsichium pennsylvanicum]